MLRRARERDCSAGGVDVESPLATIRRRLKTKQDRRRQATGASNARMRLGSQCSFVVGTVAQWPARVCLVFLPSVPKRLTDAGSSFPIKRVSVRPSSPIGRGMRWGQPCGLQVQVCTYIVPNMGWLGRIQRDCRKDLSSSRMSPTSWSSSTLNLELCLMPTCPRPPSHNTNTRASAERLIGMLADPAPKIRPNRATVDKRARMEAHIMVICPTS